MWEGRETSVNYGDEMEEKKHNAIFMLYMGVFFLDTDIMIFNTLVVNKIDCHF